MQESISWQTQSRLKASLEFTQKDVGNLSSLKSKFVGAEKDIVEIKNTVELQGNKIEFQENQISETKADGTTSEYSVYQNRLAILGKWLKRK